MLSPAALRSPPPRGGRAQTRSSGPAASPCVLCSPLALSSPPARDEGVRSPLGGHVKATDDPVGLMVEAWCSPTLVSPAGRQCSVMQLEHHQAAGPQMRTAGMCGGMVSSARVAPSRSARALDCAQWASWPGDGCSGAFCFEQANAHGSPSTYSLTIHRRLPIVVEGDVDGGLSRPP